MVGEIKYEFEPFNNAGRISYQVVSKDHCFFLLPNETGALQIAGRVPKRIIKLTSTFLDIANKKEGQP